MPKKHFLFTTNLLSLALFLGLAACGRSSVMDAPFTVEKKTADTALTAPSDQCVSEMQSKFNTWLAQQQTWYKQRKSPVPSEVNKSHLHIGTNGRVIVMVHGFLSSPEYLKDMADAFAKQGYTVVIPLLTGFGSDVNAANSATVDDWKASMNTAFDISRVCSPSISVFAHSLGAALTTQEMEDGTLTGLDRIVMLAPYYRTYSEWTDRLVYYYPFHLEQLDVATFQAWLEPLGIHLPNFKFTPEGNGTVLPMAAVRTVLSLQDELGKFKGIHVDVHVLPIVSLDDQTIDSAFALAYIKVHFKEDSPIVYPASSSVYHSLETPSDNPEFVKMVRSLTVYLNDSHH